MEIGLPEIVAEVTAAFERYEQALVSNDIETLDAMFHDDVRTIRDGVSENLYGHTEIKSFRKARSPVASGRKLSRTVITTYGRDVAVTATLYECPSAPGRVGRQMQTWGPLSARLARGRPAHVSLMGAQGATQP